MKHLLNLLFLLTLTATTAHAQEVPFLQDTTRKALALSSKNNYKKIGKPFPEQVLQSQFLTMDSNFISFSDILSKYKGNPVVIDFWANWCGPCKQEFIDGREEVAELKEQGYQFLYISIDEPEDYGKMRKDAQKYSLTDNTYMMNEGRESPLFAYMELNSIPRYILLDQNGVPKRLDLPKPSNYETFKSLLQLYQGSMPNEIATEYNFEAPKTLPPSESTLRNSTATGKGVKSKYTADPNYLVQLAITAIPYNTPDKPHQLEGFYRKVSTENDRFTNLIEAAVTIQDVAYKKAPDRDRLIASLKHLRQSNEMGKVDTAMVRKLQNARERINTHLKDYGASDFYKLISTRQREYSKPYAWFSSAEKFTERHKFKIIDMAVSGKDTIYTVAFEYRTMPSFSSGNLKINAHDFAIVELEFSQYVHGEYMGKSFTKYNEVNGKYYPVMMQFESPRLISTDIGEHQLDVHTLWVDTVMTDKFKKLKQKEQLHWRRDLHLLEFPYDSSFWANYKPLQLHPLEPEVKTSLELNDSLENQFRESAAR